jgi:hypothetical protein
MLVMQPKSAWEQQAAPINGRPTLSAIWNFKTLKFFVNFLNYFYAARSHILLIHRTYTRLASNGTTQFFHAAFF